MAVARERSRLVPLKTIPTGNPVPLPNAAMLIPPVITVDVIRSVSTILVIVLNHLIFFDNLFTNFSFIEKISLNCLIDMIVVLVVMKGLNLDKFWFHCHIRSFFV